MATRVTNVMVAGFAVVVEEKKVWLRGPGLNQAVASGEVAQQAGAQEGPVVCNRRSRENDAAVVRQRIY